MKSSEAMPAQLQESSAGKRISLELKLPLMITALLLAVLVALVWGSYRQATQAARRLAAERLQTVTTELAEMIEPQLERRLEKMRQVAADARVIAHFASGSMTTAEAARAALAPLEIPQRAGRSPELWTRSGHAVPGFVLDDSVTTAWPAGLHEDVFTVSEHGGFSRISLKAHQACAWVIVPVIAGGERVGFIVQEMFLVLPRDPHFEQLLGANLAVRLANHAGDLWLTLDGKSLPAPAGWSLPRAQEYVRASDGTGPERIGFARPIAGSPWALVAELPTADVLTRPRAFLQWISAVTLLLVMVGGVAAWSVSRGVTRPLIELESAARAIASGDYRRRVALRRSDELGGLAHSFNHMAAEVQAAQQEMERQYAEARGLADELVRANRQLKSAMAVAEASSAAALSASLAKSAFLATMSHEIRTPINAMIGYADLLDLGISGPLTDKQRDQIARIRASGKHLVSLVDEVLDLAGIESGRLRLRARVAPLEESVETALAILRPEAHAKGVELRHSCGCSEATLFFGDPQRVEQIIVNLLANAVKFTAPGGCVTVRCGMVDDRCSEVTVQDTGVGIAPELQERIFEPFMQAESGYTRTHGGVGLGLAISRRLARMMGGELSVQSRPGEGSSFTLRLPAPPAPIQIHDMIAGKDAN
jgi:signal transduction histidine kinase